MDPSPPPSNAQGRLFILLAALLWSLGGVFAKVLTKATVLGLNTPALDPLILAFYRVLFAGMVLLPTIRRQDISFRGMMVVMMLCFGAMNALYVSALTLGTAANAILLQYSAPLWMYLASIWLLGEKADRRGSIALLVGLTGIAVIVGGSWRREEAAIIAIGLASGVAYAGVLLCIRVLRDSSSRWLTVINHLFGALVLVPWIWNMGQPSWQQIGVFVLFGSVQMALPYWLVARGLRSVSPQEAGTITLLEPILNPLWVYLVANEAPSPATLIGGIFIISALLWRYWPFGSLFTRNTEP